MKHFALGRLPVGTMNKTEESYARTLELLKRSGEILWYQFEGIKLRLADKTFYTPDFFVMRHDRSLECHEVKGFWQDDARVKIKVAAHTFPFLFFSVKKKGSGWEYESFSSVASESVETSKDAASKDGAHPVNKA